MKNLIVSLNENLTPLSMILELSSATYKSAAEKANSRKEFDRAGKFMGAFFKAVEREKIDDGSFVPDKYKGLKSKLSKIMDFEDGDYTKKITDTVNGTKIVTAIDIRSMHDDDTNLYGNVVINLNEFKKLYDELKSSNYSGDILQKLKEKGLFYDMLVHNTEKDSMLKDLKGVEILIPFNIYSYIESTPKDASSSEKRDYLDFWRCTQSRKGISFYDPEHDVFYHIPLFNSSEIIKYDTTNFKLDYEFENPVYKTVYDNCMKTMSEVLKVINPNSKFITK